MTLSIQPTKRRITLSYHHFVEKQKTHPTRQRTRCALCHADVRVCGLLCEFACQLARAPLAPLVRATPNCHCTNDRLECGRILAVVVGATIDTVFLLKK